MLAPGPRSKQQRAPAWPCALVLAIALAGCTGKQRSLTYLGDPRPAEVLNESLTIDEPAFEGNSMSSLHGSLPPRTAADRSRDEVWELSLAEAIHLALANNRMIRTRVEFQSPGNPLLANAEAAPSVYDPALRETGVLIGGRGVESALSAFDPQWNTSITWGSSSAIQNNPVLSGGIPAGRALNQDTAAFQTALVKNLGYGATIGLAHQWNYQQSNQLFQLFPSTYTGNVQVSYVQPLWAGAGTEFTRIAGPLNTNVQGLSGVSQGVVISRINTDVSLVEFETQVRNMVKDVEEAYWDLYFAYRNFDSAVEARDAALATWQSIEAKRASGLTGGSDAEEAEARDDYFEQRARAEAALWAPEARAVEGGLYAHELALRRLCGLPAADGRIIRPADEPTTTRFIPNWHASLATALVHREELRKQKWQIKSLELQLKAAESLANPQLNFVSTYQVNGFGDDLFGPDGPAGTAGGRLQSAYRTMARANQTAWTLGLQLAVPLGMRNALSQVRNAELRLTKARAALAAQELEISHELAAAFQAIDYWYQHAQTAHNRLAAAQDRFDAVQADYQAQRQPLEVLLRAQSRRAQAEAAYYRGLAEYNKALALLQYRQGTLLASNNIRLGEAAWTPEAYRDALRRAKARSFELDAPAFDPLRQKPGSIVRSPPSIPPRATNGSTDQ